MNRAGNKRARSDSSKSSFSEHDSQGTNLDETVKELRQKQSKPAKREVKQKQKAQGTHDPTGSNDVKCKHC